MKDLRVLVVDDSAYNRRTLTEILRTVDGVQVVGKATDGDEALRMVRELSPDLVTLDLEMPRMDGFTFLRLLMAKRPTPVIVVSGYSNKENVFRALELGALDFVAKPTRTVTSDLHVIREELAEKVAMVRQLRPSTATRPPLLTPVPSSPKRGQEPRLSTQRPKHVVVIGASTGGPTALVRLFRSIPKDVDAAILVAQHMPPRFTKTFADRLNRLGGVKVREASGTHPLRRGEAWICPGGKCLEVGLDLQAIVKDADASDRYVPSVDRLFHTASKKVGEMCIGVILTGMGDDGAAGVESVSKRGGRVLAESPESAVIYGMPGAAERTGHVTALLPLETLGERLAQWLAQ
ncbi:MAG: chemotaxis-specific protein-glutamate methyltransferase CheB [Deltaproteobacteria bacterium]|nr:chemotaxis-specific protein-glutamate methyltransferase CheB [Deltaproteobacteria bacterium]